MALALAGVLGCETAGEPPAVHQVRYRLDWSWGRATRTVSGGWDVTTDLGYRVHLQRGWLVSYSMELVECPPAEPVALRIPAGDVWSLLQASVAYAGHAIGTPNPAAIRTQHVESLAKPAAIEAGTVTLAPQTYCQVHYLIARGRPGAIGLPTEADMLASSLYVDGTYRRTTESPEETFTLRTDVADGVLTDLFPTGRFADATAKLRVDTGVENAEVVIRRNLGTLFDGVDFSTVASQQSESKILKNLVRNVTIEIARTVTKRD